MRFQWRSVLAGIWDPNDGRFCSFTRFQWQSVLFLYEISVTVGFMFGYEISKTVGFQWWSVFFCYEISQTVSFVSLWDHNDGRFCSITRSQWRLVFSVSRFCFVTTFQWWLVLLRYEILMTVVFIRLQVFKDHRFCFVTRFHKCRQIILEGNVIATSTDVWHQCVFYKL